MIYTGYGSKFMQQRGENWFHVHIHSPGGLSPNGFVFKLNLLGGATLTTTQLHDGEKVIQTHDQINVGPSPDLAKTHIIIGREWSRSTFGLTDGLAISFKVIFGSLGEVIFYSVGMLFIEPAA